MGYELAKQLKDAGFPQKGDYGFRPLVYEGTAQIVNYHRDVPLEHDVYIPTLSELIEACGKQFARLVHPVVTKPAWRAEEHYFSQNKLAIGEGSSPEEAVEIGK